MLVHRAKIYLSQLNYLQLMITENEDTIKEFETSMYRLGALSGSEITSGSMPDCAAYARIYEKLAMKRSEAAERICEYVERQELIINQIKGLENTNYSTLLYKRYVQFKSLVRISEEMNYTYDYIREIHGKALDNFALKYNIPQKPTFE